MRRTWTCRDRKRDSLKYPFQLTVWGRVGKEEENEHGSGIRKLSGDLLVVDDDDLYILFITSCGLMG